MNDRSMVAAQPTPGDLVRLRIGFMPLVDCAPLVVARDLGFAMAEGLALDLVRETSWANIRDRIVLGHFDAAHMLAPMAVAARLGLGHIQAPVIAPYVLNQGGNSIAVTPALFAEGGGDWGAFGDAGASGRVLADVVVRRARAGREQLTFASVYPFSGHDYQLRHWMAAAGIDPDRDLRLVVVPPPYMVEAMASGSVDGICVGAPWIGRAVDAGVGRLLLPCAALWPAVPEKVLGLHESFAERHADALAALLRALDAAGAWAEEPANCGRLAALLARSETIGVDETIVARALSGDLLIETGHDAAHVEGFLRFHGTGGNGPVNRPRMTDGAWFAAQMIRWGQVRDPSVAFAAARATFSSAPWDAALGRPAIQTETVSSFEAALFEGAHPEVWLAAHRSR
jgi:two-component system, oxyanion-binding sensor